MPATFLNPHGIVPVMARMAQPDLPQPDAQWWITLAQRLNIKDKVEQFFHEATTPHNVVDRVVGLLF